MNNRKKSKVFQFIIMPLALLVAGCGSASVRDYKDTKPEFHIENYFDGHTVAKGVFQDRFGKIRRRFEVDIHGQWDPDSRTLTLNEDFVYHDGETEKRIWTIRKTAENTYQGHAGGVVGQASGESSGSAFNWRYVFDLPVNGDTWRVHFDDWLYKLDENTVLNKAIVSKFGFKLGEVILFFEKKNKEQ